MKLLAASVATVSSARKPLRVLGVEITDPGALLDLGLGGGQGLAHLLRHQPGEVRHVLAQQVGDGGQMPGALLEIEALART